MAQWAFFSEKCLRHIFCWVFSMYIFQSSAAPASSCFLHICLLSAKWNSEFSFSRKFQIASKSSLFKAINFSSNLMRPCWESNLYKSCQGRKRSVEEEQPRQPVPGDVCALASTCRTQPDCQDPTAGCSVVPRGLGWLSPAPKLTLFAF